MGKVLLSVLFSLVATVSFAKGGKKHARQSTVTPAREPSSIAAPKFSAFIADKILYVTVLGDTCNGVNAALKVDDFCKKDRVTRNAVIVCNASIDVMQTLKACADMKRTAKVVEIDLEKSDVDPNAKILRLKNGEEAISVRFPAETTAQATR